MTHDPVNTVLDAMSYGGLSNVPTEKTVKQLDAERIKTARRVLLDAAANGRTALAELEALDAILASDEPDPMKRAMAIVAKVASVMTTLRTATYIGSRANLADDGLSDLGCN